MTGQHESGMKNYYADPVYLGCGKLYDEHHAQSRDWDNPATHARLVEQLQDEADGWVLHSSATPEAMALYAPLIVGTGARWCSWRKGFAAFKKNVPVAYAWEPVIIKPARKPVVSKRLVMRDWIETEGDMFRQPDWEQVRRFLSSDVKCSITLKKGLTGAKPEAVCHWAFELMAARPDDELVDLFPGTGAVGKSWRSWQGKFTLPSAAA